MPQGRHESAPRGRGVLLASAGVALDAGAGEVFAALERSESRARDTGEQPISGVAASAAGVPVLWVVWTIAGA